MGETLLFNNFFPLSIDASVAKIQPDKVMHWCPDGEFLAIFLRPAFFSEPRASRFRSAS